MPRPIPISSSSSSPPPSTGSSPSGFDGGSGCTDHRSIESPVLHNQPQVTQVQRGDPNQVQSVQTHQWPRNELESSTNPSASGVLRSYNVGPYQHTLVPPRHRWTQYDCNVNDLLEYEALKPKPTAEAGERLFPARANHWRETNAPSPSPSTCMNLTPTSPCSSAPLLFQSDSVCINDNDDTDDDDVDDADGFLLPSHAQNHSRGGNSRRHRRPWTESEGLWLLQCVERHNQEIEAEVFRFAVRGKNWGRIAQMVGNGRTLTSCSNKYHKLMRGKRDLV